MADIGADTTSQSVTVSASATPKASGVARGGTAITNVAVFLGYLFECRDAHAFVSPDQAQEAVLALGLIVLWDWVRELLDQRTSRRAVASATMTGGSVDIKGSKS